MTDVGESPLLTAKEGPAVRVLNARGAGDIVLVCEHASRFIPATLADLGLDAEARVSHAAWDIGAMDLALELMATFDAPLVAARVSRLVYDCNRPPEAPDAIPVKSERYEVPGNRGLAERGRAERVAGVYAPFRAALAGVLDSRRPALLVTVHSFTPVYMGRRREVELGLLHDADPQVAEALLAAAGRLSGLRAALNEPYSAQDGVTHTLREHAIPRRLPNVMIEVRNDLIDTPAGVRRVAAELAAMLAEAKGTLPAPSAGAAGLRRATGL